MEQPKYCPNKNLPEYIELTKKLGEDHLPFIRQVKTMKMYMANGNDERRALSQLNPAVYSPREKEEKLKAASEQIIFINTPDPETGQPRHFYEEKGTKKRLTSVSEKLNENPALVYRSDDKGSQYADSGTNVHAIFEQVINGVQPINIKKFASDNRIPESIVDFASSFISGLQQTGTVITEINVRGNTPIAGRVDILHLKNDGTVDIYDVKTAYRTPYKIMGDKKIWNPKQDFDGYKAQRYPTQLEFYSQMVENTIGHPVSNSYILPIEIEFENNAPSNPIATISPLPVENINTYGYEKRAHDLAAVALGNATFKVPLPGLAAIDDSSDFITSLTGRIQNLTPDLDKQAEKILLSRTTSRDYKGYKQYLRSGKWVTLKSQNHAEQKQQIIQEYLGQQENSFRDIEPSIKNYINTGEDEYISNKGQSFENLRAVLDSYKGLNYDVVSLSSISGFEEKKGWVLIKKEEKTDILYIGNEDLDNPFLVSNKKSIFGGSRTLFGNLGFSSDDAKYQLGSSLKNTLGDAKRLEAAMIAMKLKSVNPLIKFDRMLVHSLNRSSSVPSSASLTELLPVLKNLFKHKDAEQFAPVTYTSLIAQEALFDPATYQQDYAKSYHDLLDDAMNARDKMLEASLTEYHKGTLAQQDVEQVVLARIIELEETGASKNPKFADQMRLLSEILYQLRNVPTHVMPVGKYFEKWASMPQNIANEVIQDVVNEFRKSLSRVRSEFWEHYKKQFNKDIATLFSSSGSIISKVGDYTISNTTKYYDRLMEKKNYKVIVLDEGKRIEKQHTLNSFNLVAEGSTEFNNLTEEERSFIVKFNDNIEKAAKMAGIQWTRGTVPLVRASMYNKFHRFLGREEGAYQGLLERAFQSMEENFTIGMDGDSKKPTSLMNRFTYQENGPTTKGNRDEMLGISADDFISLEQHSEFETNLEVISDMFMMEAIRVNEFNKVYGHFIAANNLFEWQRSHLFEEKMGMNIEWLKVWRDAMLHMRDQDSGTVQSKAVGTLNRIASLGLIAGKFSIAGVAYAAQQLSTFSQSVANSTGNSQDFGIGNWTKAFGIIANPKNFEKVNALMQQYGLHNMSMTDLTNGHRRYGNKSIFRLKYLYGLLNAGDWLTRSQLMVAQMLKHGSWDAHSIEDGKLVYDESKDERMKGDKGKAVKDFTMRELTEQGIPQSGNLSQAYGTSEGNYLKNQADQIIGGFDRESRGLYNNFALGKFVSLFKHWLPARLNALFDSKFTSRVNGALQFEKKADGSYTAFWQGKEQEGILQTLLYMKWYIMKYRNNPYQQLTPHQQNNLRVMATHVAVFGFITAAAMAFDDDDEDDPWKQAAASTLRRSLGDITATYNILALKDFLYTPIAIVFMDRTINQIINIMSGEKEINKKSMDGLINKIPMVSAFNEIYEKVDQEEEVKP